MYYKRWGQGGGQKPKIFHPQQERGNQQPGENRGIITLFYCPLTKFSAVHPIIISIQYCEACPVPILSITICFSASISLSFSLYPSQLLYLFLSLSIPLSFYISVFLSLPLSSSIFLSFSFFVSQLLSLFLSISLPLSLSISLYFYPSQLLSVRL